MRRQQARASEDWKSRLRDVKSWRPGWSVERSRGEEWETASSAQLPVPSVVQRRCRRVAFPLRFGVENCHGLVLSLVQLEVGADVKERRTELADTKAVSVADAAGVLLLAQAFCGSVAAWFTTCFAVVGLARFGGFGIPERWPARGDDFCAAASLLSIGIPLLKWRHPELHHSLKCLGSSIPVAAGYARTAAEAKHGSAEVKWRLRHRWAARRLCSLLTDLKEPCAWGWLFDVSDAVSVVSVRSTWIATRPVVALGFASDHSWFTASFPVSIRVISFRRCVKEVEEKEVGGGEFEKRFHDVVEMKEVGGRWREVKEKASVFLRACWLALVFLPLMVFGSLLYLVSGRMGVWWRVKVRMVVWWMLRWCLERGGAAFIKWGQWSATRQDLFPEDLCGVLKELHDGAPQHSYKETRKAVQRCLGCPVEEIFDDFPQRPCASGSIAQVYRAKLRNGADGSVSDVAVKVRHPSVGLRIHQDFQIMSALAAAAERLPGLGWLNLRQSVEQFSHALTSQADLRVEADNLELFRNNFDGLQETVVWPKLVPHLVSDGVIVESFERGQPLHQFLGRFSTLNTQIAAVGVDTYMKMMLSDNFVHTDLHPGNILARAAQGVQGQKQAQETLQLVLLDCGLAQKLSPHVRYHFISFITMIGAGNGEHASHHLLRFSWPNEQRCKNPDMLIQDMKQLFAADCNLRESPIDLNAVLMKVLKLCRKHQVTIDSSYATLVVAVCVLVGFANSLDPDLSIMDAAVPCLFLYNLTGRLMGRIYG